MTGYSTNKKLNIAMVSIHSCPMGKLGGEKTGGMNVYVKELSLELARRGHRLDIFTRSHEPAHEPVMEIAEKVRLVHLNVGNFEPVDNLEIYPRLPDFGCEMENYRKTLDTSYDLVHSHYWLSGLAGESVSKWWGAPHVIMFHTLGLPKNMNVPHEDETELRITTEKELARDCELVISATPVEKKELISGYQAEGSSIEVIPCGVNLELFHPLDSTVARARLGLNGYPLLLYAGRFDPAKGVTQLIQALKLLKDWPESRLLVVGGDERNRREQDELTDLAGSLDLKSRVRFTGSVAQEELMLYYNAVDVCVVPSYYESFGLVALESLACGTPVVAPPVGGLPALVENGENGYLTENNSPMELAQAMSLSLEKWRGIKKDKEKIRNTVLGYGWNRIADAMEKSYLELAG